MCKSQTPVQNIPFRLSTKAQCLINSNFSFANSHITRQYQKSILVSQKKGKKETSFTHCKNRGSLSIALADSNFLFLLSVVMNGN